MSTTIRCTLPLLLVLTAATVHAAEDQPGSLSEAATAAEPAVDTSKTNVTQPSAQPATQPATTTRSESGPRQVTRAANDRLDLDTTVVTGNRELPKVLYIVPWKKSDLGDLPAQPFNTLLDEALTPVDRDVFRREVTYYGAVTSNGGGGADGAPSQPERSEK